MKITFFYDQCLIGGLETAIKNRMDCLIDNGIDCEIIFRKQGYERDIFKNHRYYVTENEYKIQSIVNNSDYIDIISFFEPTIKKLYKINKPLIHEAHNPVGLDYLSNLDKNKIKAVIFPSNAQLNNAKYYVPKEIPLYSLYNCLGKDFLIKKKFSQINERVSKKVVLWVGRISYRKNWVFLINLAKKLRNDYVIRVLVQTAGSTEYSKFIELIKNDNLSCRFEIITDCPYKQIIMHYQRAAVNGCYLSSAYSESFGMTVLESVYCGCPCVLTDIDVFREVAEDCALYYPIDNAEVCLNKINEICNDRALRNKLISKGFEIYKTKFDPQVIYKNLISILSQIN